MRQCGVAKPWGLMCRTDIACFEWTVAQTPAAMSSYCKEWGALPSRYIGCPFMADCPTALTAFSERLRQLWQMRYLGLEFTM